MPLVFQLKSITERFRVICNIGKGSYGVVQKCQDIITNDIVAVKKILQQNKMNDCPQNTIREVLLLNELQHDNIVELKFIVQCKESDEGLYLVFEYCEYDLYALLYKSYLKPDYLKSLMKQLLVALHVLSIRRIVHRDLKPANIFVTRNNILKLGDFGLARQLSECTRYSHQVVTLWYRPPELLLGVKQYGTEVDIWSAGCILYEMVTSKVLFRSASNDDISQLIEIFKLIGRPNKDWIGFQGEKANLFSSVKDKIPKDSYEKQSFKKHLEDTIPQEYQEMIDLLLKMLALNPSERITAEEALNHPFIRSINDSIDPLKLPELTFEEIHQLIVSEERKREKMAMVAENQRPEKRIPEPIK
ncbi:Cell division control protein 2 3 [Tritrichomonas foetus]|uniref:Cell division control protein 2 3 n=1 Tax=Tritrichomonas foetus TaxID=1144522 RepID=A0A1J4JA70_9EUKA|nr:Cell division control protein 2 3 [Tritrichomonas foetus]|eukprot:OHS95127.1 Cell division control protein 2 3 [Tritrichomonas foetus]